MEKDYFQSSEFKELLATYEKDRAEGRSIYMDAEDFADIADYYINGDRCDKAMEAVDLGLSIHPDEDVLFIVKSATYIYQHEFDKAEEILKKLDPSSSDVKYQLAQLRYAKYDDTEGAEALWREWMQQETDDNPSEHQQRDVYVHVISSLVELRENILGFKDFDEEVVQRWVREYIDKFQPLGRYDEDTQLIEICRENELAELLCEILVQVLEERPYYPKGWSSLALAQFISGQYEQALDSCAFALAIDANDLEAMLTRAHTFLAMKEKGMAKAAFKEYLDKGGDPPQIIPYVELLFEDEEDDEAQRLLQKLHHFIVEKKQEAEEALQDAERNHPDDAVYVENARNFCRDAQEAYERIMADMGELYHRSTYYEESIVIYDELLAANGRNAEAYFMQGCNHLALRHYEEAAVNFGNAMNYTMSQVVMGIDIVVTLAMNGLENLALKVLDRVCEAAETEDTPHVKNIPVARSITYLKLDKKDLFLQHFKVACENPTRLFSQIYKRCFPQDMPVSEWYDYVEKNLDEFVKKMNEEGNQME